MGTRGEGSSLQVRKKRYNIYYTDNFHMLFDLTDNLTLEAGLPSSHCKPKYVCIQVPSRAPCLGTG